MSKFCKKICAAIAVLFLSGAGLCAADSPAPVRDGDSVIATGTSIKPLNSNDLRWSTRTETVANLANFSIEDDMCTGVSHVDEKLAASIKLRVLPLQQSGRNVALANFALGADMCADAPDSLKDSKAEPGQHAETFEKVVTIKLEYLLSLPADYLKQNDKKWPLILFLHGSGERGSDINLVKKHGPPKIVEQKPDSTLAKDFIVVSPQCPAGQWWKADDLTSMLDDIQKRYHVDQDRVYVTGLSMGGFGAWELATTFPDRFAAIAPMCGGGRPDMARRIKNLPIWVFHGEADGAVPFQRSVEMVEALTKVGADVKFTRYPGVGHDCWTQSYDNPELYIWFLSHKRGEKADESKKPAEGAGSSKNK